MKKDYLEISLGLLLLWLDCVISCGRSSARPKTLGAVRYFEDAVVKGHVDRPDINEISGVAQSRRHRDILYVLNDSGGMPRLFALNATTGHMVAVLTIRGTINCDWEDIAVGTGPWGISYIYIGDVGGNTRARCSTIYRIIEPFTIKDMELNIHGELKYEWNEPNCETLLVDHRGDLYLVSKVKPGNTPKLYQIPNFGWRYKKIRLHSGTNVNIELTSQGPVAGDISLSGREILIKTYENIYYWRRHPSSPLSEVLQTQPTVIPHTQEPQGEALCWAWLDRGFYTVSEGPNQPLYFYKRITNLKEDAVIEETRNSFEDARIRGYIDLSVIDEISGLDHSGIHKDVLYVLNDSGGKPRIFALNATTAAVIAIMNITGAENCDWEDLAVGPGPDGLGSYIYIGDVGGNIPNFCQTIYRVEEPEIIADISLDVHGYFTYTWEEENCETLMVDHQGTVYLVTKVFTDTSPKLYRVPDNAWELGHTRLNNGTAVNIHLETEGPVAGDISSTGMEVLLKTYNVVYYWRRTNASQTLESLVTQLPVDLPYLTERQGEAICWDVQEKGYFTVSEGKHQPLYYYSRTNDYDDK